MPDGTHNLENKKKTAQFSASSLFYYCRLKPFLEIYPSARERPLMRKVSFEVIQSLFIETFTVLL